MGSVCRALVTGASVASLTLACAGSPAPAPPERAVVRVARVPVMDRPSPLAPPEPVSADDGRGAMSNPDAPPEEAEPPEPRVDPHAAPQGDTCGLHALLGAHPTPNGSLTYSLTLTNQGKVARSLVVPGDGSSAGWRTPVLSWSAVTLAGKPAKEGQMARCGLMNAIDSTELFTLAPGASKVLSGWIDGPRLPPGTYYLRLRYRNDPKLAGGRARTEPAAAKGIAASSPCDVTSAPLRVTLK